MLTEYWVSSLGQLMLVLSSLLTISVFEKLEALQRKFSRYVGVRQGLHYREVPLTGMQAEILLPDIQLKRFVSQMFLKFCNPSKNDGLGNSFYDTFDICNDSAAIIRRCVPAALQYTGEWNSGPAK
ncbi:hypothetical protein J6590_090268 [Homalodisca vitripennis]|nr:hypothetical protein J6590_090268 [Homalodisca vitripennis]